MTSRNPNYSLKHPPKPPGRPTPLPPQARQRVPLAGTRPLSNAERLRRYGTLTDDTRPAPTALSGLTPAQRRRALHKSRHHQARPARLRHNAERTQQAAERRAAGRLLQLISGSGIGKKIKFAKLKQREPVLTPPEHDLLAVIRGNGCTPKQAAAQLGWTVQRVVPISGRLEKLGMIGVTRLHKQTSYEITAAGEQALAE